MDDKLKIKVGLKTADILQIPEDILLNMPRFTMLGDRRILVENPGEILKYTPTEIKLFANIGFVIITGEGFIIDSMDREELLILGKIKNLEFKRGRSHTDGD